MAEALKARCVLADVRDSFVGHHDTAFRQQIFDVAKAQGKPHVKPDRLLDDFQREPVPLVADFLHPPGYLTASEAASPNRRDKAVAIVRRAPFLGEYWVLAIRPPTRCLAKANQSPPVWLLNRSSPESGVTVGRRRELAVSF
jgi:hypothetical protein